MAGNENTSNSSAVPHVGWHWTATDGQSGVETQTPGGVCRDVTLQRQADTQSELRRPWRQPSEHSFKISGLSDNMLLLQPELDKNIEVQHYIVIKVTFRLFSSF